MILLAGICSIASIWALVGLSSHAYQTDLEQQILEQQSRTLNVLAAEIDQEIRDRIGMLEAVAGKVSPAMLTHPALAQTFLHDRIHLPQQFNRGHYLVNASGGMVASVPEVLAQTGLAYKPDKEMLAQLYAGKSVISKAVQGKRLKTGVFGIASPVRDPQGQTIGALVGTMDLGSASFLNRITASVPNSMVRYRLISLNYRQIVTATDPVLILQDLPSVGTDSVLDKLLDGRLTSTRRTDDQGRESLVTVAKVPSAGWLLLADLSTHDAFSASEQIKSQVWLLGLLMTAMVLLLNGWFIHRQMTPMSLAHQTLQEMATGNLPWRLLPAKGRKDEVGHFDQWLQRTAHQAV